MEKIILRIRFEYQGDWPDEEKKVGGSGGGEWKVGVIYELISWSANLK